MSTPAPRPPSPPVLLIEDEPAVMIYVRAVLERSGYAVVCSESGAEGLRALASGSFLGIVSDMRTPGGISGADVHDWIRQHRPELASRLVFITGDIANEDHRAVLISERHAVERIGFDRAAVHHHSVLVVSELYGAAGQNHV